MGTNNQQFFPANVDQDQSWGTSSGAKIKQLDEAAGAGNTTCGHPNAAGTTECQMDPYAVRASTLGLDPTNMGWAWHEAGVEGMESIATAKRIIVAGDWTFQWNATVPAAGAATGSHTCSFKAAVYRVATGGGTRTLIFETAYSTTLATSLTLTATGTVSVTYTAPEIILEAGETLHIAYTSKNVQVAGLAGATTAGNILWISGATSFATVATPGIRTRFLRGTADGIAGSVSPAGSKRFGPTTGVMLKRSGSITPTGVKVMQPNLFRAGLITPTGISIKQPRTQHEGVIVSSGLILKHPQLIKSGMITPTPGAIIKQVRLIRLGAITPASVVQRFLSMFWEGSITPAGNVRKQYQPLPKLGTITSSGALIKRPGKVFTALITPTSTMGALLRKTFTALITPTGTVAKGLFKTIGGNISPTGTVYKTIRKYFSGFLGPGEGGIAPVVRKIIQVIFDD